MVLTIGTKPGDVASGIPFVEKGGIVLNQLRMAILLAVWAFLLSIATWSDTAAAAEYTSPDGMRIQSESSAWNSPNKLKQVYEELKKNIHGEEWKYLSQLTIHDGYPKGKTVAGEYNMRMSADLLGRKKILPGSIDIYGGSERTTVESIAKTLSHEYGHHVTHYLSLKQDGFSLADRSRWRESTYAQIRGLSNNPQVNQTNEHRWELVEIAAEDYVQLFGSPTAKHVHWFPSHYDLLQQGKEIGPVEWDASMYNLNPQENVDLPLASKVPSLYQWFADFFAVRQQAAVPGEPKLTIKQVIREGQGYQIHFAWTASGGKSPANVTYTFVSYGDGERMLPEPIVTRKSGEPLEARYGTVVMRTASSIITYKDPNAKGVRHFRVYAQNEQGFVSASPTLTLDMDRPDQVTVSELNVQQTAVGTSSPVSIQDPPFKITSSGDWEAWIINGISQLMILISRMIEELIKFVS
jgi:hypothetical protein